MTTARWERVEVDGAACELLHRPGTGPALLLLHGAGAHAACWEPVLSAWDGFDVWCPSLAGRPGSPGAPADSAAGAARWIARVAAAAGLVRPIAAGHSYGGAVALELAMAGDAAGLAMIASGARLRVAPAILAAADAATPDRPFLPDIAFLRDTPAAVVQAYLEACARTPPATTAADWHTCDRFDRLGALGGVACPALVVHGELDPLTPARHQAALAAQLPHARRVELPRAGHMVPWEDPRAVADAVRAWSAAGPAR